ncbi:MAG TPA: HPr family phosphocarrier protein [Roseiflexaceae bacterium]|nr:HPr family phosphocarrier protein [Roseiflexaceae bacterium]
MVEATLIISSPQGLHARPAADFYRTARAFKSRVTIQNLSQPNSSEVPVSLYNLLRLGVAQGHRVRVRADGEDERDAIRALAALVEQHRGGE